MIAGDQKMLFISGIVIGSDNMMVQFSSPPADSRILTTWFPNMRLVQLGCRNCGIVKMKMTKESAVQCPVCGGNDVSDSRRDDLPLV